MESDKEDARRAMDMAERKLSHKDYEGAKRYVSKAQKLYPKLDGLIQVLTIIDVYLKRKRGDWYGILGVDPLANDVTVKKQYKKLALNLVLDAWCFLSDPCKRKLLYDQQRRTCGNEEAERLFKSRMKTRANENSTSEAQRLFKKPAVVFASEAERLFKIPVPRGDPRSTSEAQRLFGMWRHHPNSSTCTKTFQESYHTSK